MQCLKNPIKVQEKFIEDDQVQHVSYSVLPLADSVASLKNHEVKKLKMHPIWIGMHCL